MERKAAQVWTEWLVLRCQGGDAKALNDLIIHIRPGLVGAARAKLGEPAAVEDVVQETCIGICRGIRKLRDPAAFRAWCYQLLSNKCNDWLRRRVRSREREVPHPVDGAAAAAASSTTNTNLDLEQAITRLAPDVRLVLYMFYVEGMSLREMSQSLEVPVGTVKSRLFAARTKLRKRFDTDSNTGNTHD